MRARVFALLTALVCAVLLALGLPLAVSLAHGEQQRVFLDRFADTRRFASLAGQDDQVVARTALQQAFRRYDEVYGIGVTLLDRSGAVLLRSRPASLPDDESSRTSIARAERGAESGPPDQIWPWQREAMVLAAPVTQAGEVTGVVVTASPTDGMRGRTTRAWSLLGLGMALAALVSVVLATRLARWVVRPVARLDDVAHRLATGELDVRAEAASGPPELRRLAASFNEMAEQIEQTLQAQRAFVADASHQLRNPLLALLLRLEQLGVELGAEPESLSSARREGRRLTQVVDSLLDLAQAERRLPPAVDVDLTALVRDRAEAWQPMAAAAGVGLRLDLAPGVSVRGHQAVLSSVLDALLDNAVKFSAGCGDVTLVVASTVLPDSTAAGQVSILDSGPGLTAEELERIGDRFWRSPRHQNVAGTGLGLAVARALVTGYGGVLDIGQRERGQRERGQRELGQREQRQGLAVSVLVPAVERPGTLTASSRGSSAARPGATARGR
ncbi:MAG: HAMP domain-containing sensor histidine kinase [Actinomycetales bacterium]